MSETYSRPIEVNLTPVCLGGQIGSNYGPFSNRTCYPCMKGYLKELGIDV